MTKTEKNTRRTKKRSKKVKRLQQKLLVCTIHNEKSPKYMGTQLWINLSRDEQLDITVFKHNSTKYYITRLSKKEILASILYLI